MSRTSRAPNTDVALLRIRIAESGLSDRQFAKKVLKRDERTVRRYLAGDNDIPPLVKELLRKPFVAPWPTEKTLPMLDG